MSAALLPPNSTPLEHALANVCVLEAIQPEAIATLWSPQRCPVQALPWLAWAFSVDNWDAGWPEATQRKAIADAYFVHRQKGTLGAIRRAVEILGAEIGISEWFQHGGDPHTFRLRANASATWLNAGVTLGPAYLDQLCRVVNNTKPVRSHYTFDIEARFAVDIGLAVAAGPASAARVFAEPTPPRALSRLRLDASACAGKVTTVRLFAQPCARQALPRVVLGAAAVKRLFGVLRLQCEFIQEAS